MATLAKNILVTRVGMKAELQIDGEPFPWVIADAGISLTVVTGDIPSITITVLSESIRVIDDFQRTNSSDT